MADIILTRGETKRFWMDTRWRPDTGCLEWLKKVMPNGYGSFSLSLPDRHREYVHRIAYSLTVGPIPEGMCVLHKCDNRCCVNTDHLFLGTLADNNRDRDAKGRNGWAKRSHCKHGHPFRGDNLRVTSRGRVCVACERNAAQKRKSRMG